MFSALLPKHTVFEHFEREKFDLSLSRDKKEKKSIS
jgi:hypothetical protein